MFEFVRRKLNIDDFQNVNTFYEFAGEEYLPCCTKIVVTIMPDKVTKF